MLFDCAEAVSSCEPVFHNRESSEAVPEHHSVHDPCQWDTAKWLTSQEGWYKQLKIYPCNVAYTCTFQKAINGCIGPLIIVIPHGFPLAISLSIHCVVTCSVYYCGNRLFTSRAHAARPAGPIVSYFAISCLFVHLSVCPSVRNLGRPGNELMWQLARMAVSS